MNICAQCVYTTPAKFAILDPEKVLCWATRSESARDPVTGEYKMKTCREKNIDGSCPQFALIQEPTIIYTVPMECSLWDRLKCWFYGR